MRAVKRERYGEKELKRLNEMLIKAGDIQFLPEIKEEKTEEETMVVEGEIEPMAEKDLVSGPRRSRFEKSLKKGAETAEQVDLTTDKEEDTEKMAVDGERIFRKKTMRDQYGNYPDWMNKRKMRTQQKKNKRLKKRAKSLKRK